MDYFGQGKYTIEIKTTEYNEYYVIVEHGTNYEKVLRSKYHPHEDFIFDTYEEAEDYLYMFTTKDKSK